MCAACAYTYTSGLFVKMSYACCRMLCQALNHRDVASLSFMTSVTDAETLCDSSQDGGTYEIQAEPDAQQSLRHGLAAQIAQFGRSYAEEQLKWLLFKRVRSL